MTNYLELALSTWPYINQLQLYNAIDRAANLGFKIFEVPGDRSHAWPKDMKGPIRRRLKELLTGKELEVEIISVATSYMLGPGLCNEDPVARSDTLNYLCDMIEVGYDFGASKIIVGPGRPLVETPPSRAHELAVEGLGECVDYARNFEMTVCIENAAYSSWLLDTADKMSQMINDVASPNLGIRLDPGHSRVSKTNFSTLCARFKDRIKSVGIHDNFGQEDTHDPIGKGDVNFHFALDSLRKVGYDGNITLEIKPRERWNLEDVDGYVRESKDFLRKIITG